MGYEKGITLKWSEMVLKGNYPEAIPGYPKTPDQPGRGTPNHQVLAHLARLTWALEKGTPAQQAKELDAAVQFFDNQVEGGFMARGKATEQLSPSHSQWWLTAVLGLRWIGWKERSSRPDVSRKLLDVTGRWLRHHHALCKLFATREGIVAPGARAWPLPKPDSDKRYDGKCKLRDVLYEAIETGRVKKLWTADNLDMLGVIFADKLLKEGDDLGGAKGATELPKLKWPMSYRRKGDDFTAWLTTLEDNDDSLPPQRLASWKGGQESYGFADALEDVLEQAEARVLGQKPEGGGGNGGGGGGEEGVPALIAALREVAGRRPAASAELLALASQLEAQGADVGAVVAGLRELAGRRPAARGEVLDIVGRLERVRERPVV